MSKILFLLTFLSFPIHSYSQPPQRDLKVYYEKSNIGYKIFLDNNEYCPFTVTIDFTLTNMKSINGNNKTIVVPARTLKFKITELEAINNRQAYKFEYKYVFNYGNHLLNTYEQDYIYYLPYEINQTYSVSQGYNGQKTHHNENALDFSMPIGAAVHAAREGIVIEVVDNNDFNGADESFRKFNNHLIIYHPDGTFAEYSHIQKNGSIVKKGDTVEKGQLIAKSGNVGFTTGPHLHFAVFFQRLKGREFLKTKFAVGNGEEAEYLVENKEYTRSYK